MDTGDVCVLGRTAYAVASHPDEIPIDGQILYMDGDVAHVGGDETIGIGGSVTLNAAGADFLLDMLPVFMLVPRSSPAADAVATILALISSELERGMMGGEIVGARLADVLLVEAIRAYAGRIDPAGIGWLRALSDTRISRALHAIHGDIARAWTVAELGGLAGMSRAAFAAEFTRLVGQPPLTYVRKWRLALARAALTRGGETVANVANSLGYRSQSAFGNAFRRAFGVAPIAISRSSREQQSN